MNTKEAEILARHPELAALRMINTIDDVRVQIRPGSIMWQAYTECTRPAGYRGPFRMIVVHEDDTFTYEIPDIDGSGPMTLRIPAETLLGRAGACIATNREAAHEYHTKADIAFHEDTKWQRHNMFEESVQEVTGVCWE